MPGNVVTALASFGVSRRPRLSCNMHILRTCPAPGWLAGEVERETETDGVAQGKHSDNDVEGASKASA